MRLPKSGGFLDNLARFEIKVDYKTSEKFSLRLAENACSAIEEFCIEGS